MNEKRTIVHVDLDAFYCAVEEQFNPSLSGKAFAVGGHPKHRGVVSSCSYAARNLGIHSAMPMSQAVRLCPELIILPGRRREYSQRSKQVMHVLNKFSSTLEQISIDEAFLDISEIDENISSVAHNIQDMIKKETALPCSLGVASNKLVAKIATDIGKISVQTKTYPQAIHIVPHGKEAAFLHNLPLEMLWGVGPKTAEKLQQIGMNTIGDLANWPQNDLVQRLGKNGYDLHRRANGIDNREVVTYREPKSFSQENTFSRDTADQAKIKKHLRMQSESLHINLNKAGLVGSTIKLKIRWADFSVITRQVTLPQPTNDQEKIYQQALMLLDQNWNRKDLIRLIGLGVANFQQPEKQLNLWDKKDYKKIADLESAVYKVKSKFGSNAIFTGTHFPESDNKPTNE